MDRPDIITQYFPELNKVQRKQYEMLGAIYESWNQKINVISRKDIEALYTRHVLHSLGIAKFISFEPGAKIMDAGTGGGFPGIPLAIMFPDSKFLLVDSTRKKIRVVSDVVQVLGLKNVQVSHERIENIPYTYNFVVSRAVARIDAFLKWTKDKIIVDKEVKKDNGILYLKGGDFTDELSILNRDYKIIELRDYFSESFFETKKLVYIPFI